MSDFLQQRHEALTVVLERLWLAYLERPLHIRSVANGSRGRTMGALRAQAAQKQKHRAIGEEAGKLFRDHVLFVDRRPPFHVVRITRIAPRFLDDDNLASAMKAIRDGVAKALRIDDRDPRIRYVVDQRRGQPKENVVRLELYAPPHEGPPRAFADEASAAMQAYHRKPHPTPNYRRPR